MVVIIGRFIYSQNIPFFEGCGMFSGKSREKLREIYLDDSNEKLVRANTLNLLAGIWEMLCF